MSDYDKFVELNVKIADISNSMSVLNWDQEVNLPKNGLEKRAKQISTLAGISHELLLSKEYETLVKKLQSQTLTSIEKANVKEAAKVLTKNKKLTTDYIRELAETQTLANNAWLEARNKSDFSIFEPFLEKILNLKFKECDLIGYDKHPYDVMLDTYEPGLTTERVEIIFKDAKSPLLELLGKINKKEVPNNSFMLRQYNKAQQWDFGIYLLKQMGYDFDSGRQDLSAHPFTTSLGPNDVRITTRINEQNLYEMIWSCIHEGGHALYEQGLPADQYGLAAGEYASLGIHESQSRIWENNVGRSLSYWKANFKVLKDSFPDRLANVTLVDFYKAINIVKPSLIRTASDELTYHFHVMIRFEIEKALFEKSIKIKDLPSVWNDKYKSILDVNVPNDAQGVLQDIHWSHGSFGYFPTYSIGSFYAAQFYNKAQKDIPNLEGYIEKGDMKPLLKWLRKNIHQYGRVYNAEELCEKVTGSTLNSKYFMDYANQKYGGLYEL